MRNLLASLAVCSAAVQVEARTLVVDPSGGGEFREVQAAIDAAAPGDEVLLKPGVFLVAPPLTFRGKAITVRGEAGADETVLRRAPQAVGEADQPLLAFRDGEGEDAVLEGLTIAGELTDATSLPWGAMEGRGILCLGSSPTIRDCVIAAHAAFEGGGVACHEGSAPRFERCRIAWNVAFSGGGVYLLRSDPTFEDCTIAGNYAEPADAGGAGIVCIESSPRLRRCRLVSNVTICGSAIHVDGGAPRLESCLVYANLGGALELHGADCSSPVLLHCTIASNGINEGGCDLMAVACRKSCILWGGELQFPGVPDPDNLIAADPLFVDPGLFEPWRQATVLLAGREVKVFDHVVREPDFNLLPGSPAIDQASALEPLPATDFGGRPRSCGGRPDLGAQERIVAPELDANRNDIPDECEGSPRLAGDCNEDGALDIADPSCLLGHLFLGAPERLPCGDGQAGDTGNLELLDMSGDRRLDLSDAVYVLSYLFLGGPRPVEGECAAVVGCGAGECGG